jgi:protein tyrosine phosphatase
MASSLFCSQVHRVAHLHLLNWSDHDVPDQPTDVLRLMNEALDVRGNSKTPIIVHCSAGVGRSGMSPVDLPRCTPLLTFITKASSWRC